MHAHTHAHINTRAQYTCRHTCTHMCTGTHAHTHTYAHAQTHIYTCTYTDFSAGQVGQLGFPGWAGGEGRGRPASPVTEPAREAATSGGRSHICLWAPMLTSSFPGLPGVKKPQGNLCGWALLPKLQRQSGPGNPRPSPQAREQHTRELSLSVTAQWGHEADILWPCTQRPLRSSTFISLHVQKIPQFILASALQEQPGRNPSRSFICTGALVGPETLGLSGDGRQRKARSFSLHSCLLLSLRLACLIPQGSSSGVVGRNKLQKGQPLATGQLSPPAPSSPDHSCMPTLSHQDPQWPEPSFHGQPAGLGVGRAWTPTEAPRVITPWHPPTSGTHWQSGALGSHPAGWRSPVGCTCSKAALPLCSNRFRPPVPPRVRA